MLESTFGTMIYFAAAESVFAGGMVLHNTTAKARFRKSQCWPVSAPGLKSPDQQFKIQ